VVDLPAGLDHHSDILPHGSRRHELYWAIPVAVPERRR